MGAAFARTDSTPVRRAPVAAVAAHPAAPLSAPSMSPVAVVFTSPGPPTAERMKLFSTVLLT